MEREEQEPLSSPQGEVEQKAAALHALVHGPLSSSLARLSDHSRAIPTGKDFHFYNNFDDFRLPVRHSSGKSLDLLSAIASSSTTLRKPPDDDLDDAYDWLVGLNDELAERFGASVDEFAASRREMEAEVGGGRKVDDDDDGFQVVRGRNKKKRNGDKNGGGVLEGGSLEVKVAERDKKTEKARSKVPFHMPHIPRPQDEYTILVNNANQPFEHVWLESSEDGSCFLHPLEKLSVSDFIDRHVGQDVPIKPLPLEDTPFRLVEGVKELKDLAAKLRNATEFSVDLEHNHYRSFQGLTCLMQISTRTEDFVVDTLKLRIHIGPHLREVFKDPYKRKIMHGADRDILWLQRDFGIYVCNLFDTGQASRVLQLERNSLEHLLRHFCEVSANKEYQSADWRLRPLPDEMIKYAREDTHYLLYLYDIMRLQLLSKSSSDSGNGSAIMEVYKRSYDICMQLYEKELLTDTSYLYIYGLREADFNSQQLAVVAGLCEWRDGVARAEDDSTGYVLPNRTLLEIARQMPLTSSKLRRLLNSKHPIVECYLGSVVGTIRSSIQNAPAFETVVEELKRAQFETVSELNNQPIFADSESLQADEDLGSKIPQIVNKDSGLTPMIETSAICMGSSVDHVHGNIKHDGDKAYLPDNFPGEKLLSTSSIKLGCPNGLRNTSAVTVSEHMDYGSIASSNSTKVNIASVQVLKKPSSAFGALLGSSKKKPNLEQRMKSADQEMAEVKLEQIKSSVSLPFHSFSGLSLEYEKVDGKPLIPENTETQDHSNDVPNPSYDLEDVIHVDNESHADPPEIDVVEVDAADRSAALEADIKDEPLSLAELSSSFQKCLESKTKRSIAAENGKKSQNSNSSVQFESFDYEAARKQTNFMGDNEGGTGGENNDSNKRGPLGRHKGSVDAVKGIEQGAEFQQPRRRQAFPPSGNRSATFR